MIIYNPKDWLIFIFKFHKSDTIRTLWPLMLAAAVLSGGIAYLELKYLKLTDTSYVKQISMMHNLLGFVLSMLLVFRTNTSYDRWWEGRKLLGGLTNLSRNISMKLKALNLSEEDTKFFAYGLPKYAFALKEHLREKSYYGKNSELIEVKKGKHIPNQIATSLTQKVYELAKKGDITQEQLIVLDKDISELTNICGGCERIKRTPIPYSYSAFIKKFIFIYVITLPIGWVFNLGYYVIPVVPFILYVLTSLELLAEEIENPFGLDDNDLPVDEICENIEKHVEEILS